MTMTTVQQWLGLLRPLFLDLNQTFSGLGKIIIDGNSLINYLLVNYIEPTCDAIDLENFQSLHLTYQLERFIQQLSKINNEEMCIVFFNKQRSFYSEPSQILCRSFVECFLQSFVASKSEVPSLLNIRVIKFEDWWADKSWKEFLISQRISFVLTEDGEFAKKVWASNQFEQFSVLFLKSLSSFGIHSACLNSCFSVKTTKIHAFCIVPEVDKCTLNEDEIHFLQVTTDHLNLGSSIESEYTFTDRNSFYKAATESFEPNSTFVCNLFSSLQLLDSFTLDQRSFSFNRNLLAEHEQLIEEANSFLKSLYFQFSELISNTSSVAMENLKNFVDVFDAKIFMFSLLQSLNNSVSYDNSDSEQYLIANQNILCRYIDRNEKLRELACIDYETGIKAQLISIPYNNSLFLQNYEHSYSDMILEKADERTPSATGQLTDRELSKIRRKEQKHARFFLRYTESLEGSKGLHRAIVTDEQTPSSATTLSGKEKKVSGKAQKLIQENINRQVQLQREKDSKNLDGIIDYLKQLKTTQEQISYLETINLKNFSFDLTWKIYAAKLDLLIYSWKENIYDFENKHIPFPNYDKLTAILYYCIEFFHLFCSVAPDDIVMQKPIGTLVAVNFKDLAVNLIETSSLDSKKRSAFLKFISEVTVSKKLSNPMSTIRYQLKYGGPYFPRNLNSKPDPRVLFNPDGWQIDLLDIVDKNESAFICAPTSSGKTFISYYAMEKVLRAGDDGIVVFVAPTRPLITQVQAEIFARFHSKTYPPNSGNVLCGVYSKDFCEHPFNCQILVTIPQILQILLESPDRSSWIQRIKYVVLDEIHMINEEEFANSWERIIQLIDCPLLAMSATIENRFEFFSWIQNVQKSKNINCHLIQHFERYSDLKKYFYLPSKLNYTLQPDDIRSVSKSISENSQSIVDIHPLATVTYDDIKVKGITEDLVFLPEESLELFEALKDILNGKERESFVESHDPDFFFTQGKLLSKQDARSYEKSLKDFLIKSIRSNTMSVTLFNSLKEKLCGVFFEKSNQLEMACPFGDLSSKPFLKQHFLQLAIDLKSSGKLPALFFYIDEREFCNEIAISMVEFLGQAEQCKKSSLSDKLDKMKISKAEKTLKALKKARDTAKVTKDSWIDEAIQNEEVLDSLTDVEEVDPDFSFSEPRYKLSRKEMDEIIHDLKRRMKPTQMPLLEGLRRGIGVHHTGLPKRYLRHVEYLFRKRHLQVVISSQTLALGINMPCKSAVFVGGDSLNLNSVQFRQMSGRAGRRGFDDIGHVIFYGTTSRKISKLLSSRLPKIQGSCPFNTNLILSMLSWFSCSDKLPVTELRKKLNTFETIVEFPLYLLDATSYNKELATFQIRFLIDFLVRNAFISFSGQTAILSRLAMSLSECKENFIIIYLLVNGVFDKIVTEIKEIDVIYEEIIFILSHFIEVKYVPMAIARSFVEVKSSHSELLRNRHQSQVLLSPLPPNIKRLISTFNQTLYESLESCAKVFCQWQRSNQDQHSNSNINAQLPISSLSFPTKVNNEIFSHFSTLSINPRTHKMSPDYGTLREGISLSIESLPVHDIDLKQACNSYILDYYKHGHVKTIEWMNGVSEAELWQCLDSFSRILKFTVNFMKDFPGLFPPKTTDAFDAVSERFDLRFKEMYA